MFNQASGQLLGGIPAAHRTFRGFMFSTTSGQLLCENTREIPATWISICTQGTERFSCDQTAALARHKHNWISLRAQKDMFRRKDCCDLALPPKIIDFDLRTPDPISTVKRAHVPDAIGNP